MSVNPIGESLLDMAPHTKPTDKTTQNAKYFNRSNKSRLRPTFRCSSSNKSLAELANNPICTAEVGDTGATGEVLSGRGNRLPADIETKNIVGQHLVERKGYMARTCQEIQLLNT